MTAGATDGVTKQTCGEHGVAAVPLAAPTPPHLRHHRWQWAETALTTPSLTQQRVLTSVWRPPQLIAARHRPPTAPAQPASQYTQLFTTTGESSHCNTAAHRGSRSTRHCQRGGGQHARPCRACQLVSRLPALSSRPPAPVPRLPAPGPRLRSLGSRLPAPVPRLPAPGSSLSAPGSSSLPDLGSSPGSRLLALASRLQSPGSRLLALGSRSVVQSPGYRFMAPSLPPTSPALCSHSHFPELSTPTLVSFVSRLLPRICARSIAHDMKCRRLLRATATDTPFPVAVAPEGQSAGAGCEHGAAGRTRLPWRDVRSDSEAAG